LGAFGNFGGLGVVYEDGQAAQNDGLDFEEVVFVDPDCVVLAQFRPKLLASHTFVRREVFAAARALREGQRFLGLSFEVLADKGVHGRQTVQQR